MQENLKGRKSIMREQNHTATNILLGMAAGAAVSAAGMYLASQNERELKHLAKKVTHGAENALGGLETVLDNFMR
jgi:hypothetical protein